MNNIDTLVKRAYMIGPVPSLGSGIGFTVVFSIFFSITSIICFHYHQWWFLCSWGAGLVLEVIGYAGRIWYNINDESSSAYIMQSVCITVAPCFLLAGIYNILGQLILIYGDQFSVLKPRSYSAIFITCDVISLFVQGGGGGVSSRDNGDSDTGRYIVIGGLAFQLLTMTIFQYFWYTFLWRIYKSERLHGETEFNPHYSTFRANRKLLKPFMAGVSLTFILIYVRSFYRVIETGHGYTSYLLTNEIYYNILEGMMISLAALIMAVLSPGYVYGRGAHLNVKKDGSSSPDVVKEDYLMDTSKVRYDL